MVRDSRGVLSRVDREYLVGESDIEEKSQAERNVRARIRERVRNALLDFRYLADPGLFEDRDLEQILERKDEGLEVTPETLDELAFLIGEPDRDPEIEVALTELVAFAFRASPSNIEQIVKSGVQRALQRLDSNATVGEIDIPIEDPEEIAARVEQLMDDGVGLTEQEIRVAFEQEVRPDEEIAAHIRKHGTREFGAEHDVTRLRREGLFGAPGSFTDTEE